MTLSEDSIQVLHVDDEPDFAELTAQFLENTADALTVETATNASDAIDLLEQSRYDCVISDYDMPEQNGIEFLETVREKFPELPFILFTGKGSEDVASDAIAAGITDYLQKRSGTDQYELLANRVRNAVERHRASQVVSETEKWARTLLEYSSDYLFVVDNTGQVAYASPSIRRVMGYEPDEVIGTDAFDLVHEDDLHRAREALAETLDRPNDDVTVEFRAKHADGSYRWLEVRGRNLLDDPVIEGVLVNGRDVTERKERERDLQQERERFAALYNNFPEPTITYEFVNDEPIIKAVNDAFVEVFGHEAAAAVGEPVDELIVPEDKLEQAQAIDDRVQAGELIDAELTRKTAAGTRDFRFRNIPLQGQDPPDGFGVYTDITERKERERELQRYRKLVETVGDPMYILDPEGYITMVNQAAIDQWGYDREQFVGTHALEIMVEEDYGRGTELIVELLESEEQWGTFEMRSITSDGETIVNENKIGVLTENGEYAGSVGVVRDISDRKEYERTLTALHDSVTGLLEAESRAGACDIVMTIAEQELDHPYSSVFLWDEDDQVLRAEVATEAARDTFGEPPTFEIGEGIVGNAYERGERLVLSDAQEDPRALEDGSASIHGYCVIPLDDYGALVFGSPKPDTFDDQAVQLASILAAHLTVALDRIVRERTLSRLQEQFQSLMYTESKLETARLVVEVAAEVTGLPLNGVHLLDETGQVLEGSVMTNAVMDVFEQPPSYLRGSESGTSDAIVWDSFLSEEPLYIDDTHAFDRLEPEPPTRSVMIYPLGDHGVFIASGIEPEAFDETDRSMFEVLATALTAALDRVDREQTLRHQREELQRQNERLDQFASVVSHDLQNPLSVADGRLELAMEECDSDHLESVAGAHDRMEALIEDMLTLAKSGDNVGDLESIQLPVLVDTCWSHVETGGAELVVETEVGVRGDRSRVRQLLENLFRNSIEHGGHGVTVTVGDTADGFYVEDDGPGIPDDVRVDVFEPGYTTSESGTGFGLSIVRDIAEAHGWTIDLKSNETGGARFEVTGVEFVD